MRHEVTSEHVAYYVGDGGDGEESSADYGRTVLQRLGERSLSRPFADVDWKRWG